MKVALAQINPILGDLAGNGQRIAQIITDLNNAHTVPDLIVFPELALWGYAPGDLLLQRAMLRQAEQILREEILPLTERYPAAVLLGKVSVAELADQEAAPGRPALYNSALLLERGQLRATVSKKLLPNYEVFNEARYFRPAPLKGADDCLIRWRGYTIAVFICEDLLGLEGNFQDYPQHPLQYSFPPLDLAICLAGSPYRQGQIHRRSILLRQAQKQLAAPLLLVNQVGANDDLIFDGSSLMLDRKGDLNCQLPSFQEEIRLLETGELASSSSVDVEPSDWELSGQHIEEIRAALILGIRDYFWKTGFQKAFLGLSGGVDSALVLCLTVEALGANNVTALLMPSRYSSPESLSDAQQLVEKLGVASQVLEITPLLDQFLITSALQPLTLAEENAQARLRGMLLMGLANQHGGLVLATSNKSELAVGYSTLYGDSCGALAPIGDLWKSQVWQLAQSYPQIPQQILQKAPSAELHPQQKDSDSLPDYSLLDRILIGLLEEGRSARDLQLEGIDATVLKRVLVLLSRAEFKRKQAPLVLKVSKVAFGKGWQFPVASGEWLL